MNKFAADTLTSSAKGYKKVSKGSDHWLATELMLATDIIAPIAHAIDFAVNQLAWPHQMLLNLNPELAKASGGTRTITKTPILYRLWCKTRKTVFRVLHHNLYRIGVLVMVRVPPAALANSGFKFKSIW